MDVYSALGHCTPSRSTTSVSWFAPGAAADANSATASIANATPIRLMFILAPLSRLPQALGHLGAGRRRGIQEHRVRSTRWHDHRRDPVGIARAVVAHEDR